jgi:hypothetical protein
MMTPDAAVRSQSTQAPPAIPDVDADPFSSESLRIRTRSMKCCERLDLWSISANGRCAAQRPA